MQKSVRHGVDVYLNEIKKRKRNVRSSDAKQPTSAHAIAVRYLRYRMQRADASLDASCVSVLSASCRPGAPLSKTGGRPRLLERRKMTAMITRSQNWPS